MNPESEVVLCEGDLVDGSTVSRIEADRLVLAKNGKESFVTLANIKRLDPNLSAKTYSAAYAGENSFYSRTEESRDSQGLAHSPRLKKVANTRPKFVHPMSGQGWISSPFGERIRPRTWLYQGGGKQFHSGIDIAAPYGTKVRAAADGRVTDSGWSADKGRFIEILHSGGYETRYYHLYRIKVSRGQVVKAREVIGLEGNTGNSNGPHLHFEIRKNSVPMDPALFVRSLRGGGRRR